MRLPARPVPRAAEQEYEAASTTSVPSHGGGSRGCQHDECPKPRRRMTRLPARRVPRAAEEDDAVAGTTSAARHGGG
jgi:hypothetical protein